MTHEQILQIARATPNVGAVKHEEFVNFIIAPSQRKKTDEGWQTTEAPYMPVDGKLAMANTDHQRQNKKMTIGPATVLANTDTDLTLQVGIESEVYGTRYGIATSRKVDGTQAERTMPWEVAETSAIGRALSGFGYGVFPGSGMASADDMKRVGIDESKNPRRSETQQTSTKRAPLSATQRAKILELTAKLTGETSDELERIANSQFASSFQHPLTEGTYDEGTKYIALLMQNLKADKGTGASGR